MLHNIHQNIKKITTILGLPKHNIRERQILHRIQIRPYCPCSGF